MGENHHVPIGFEHDEPILKSLLNTDLFLFMWKHFVHFCMQNEKKQAKTWVWILL